MYFAIIISLNEEYLASNPASAVVTKLPDFLTSSGGTLSTWQLQYFPEDCPILNDVGDGHKSRSQGPWKSEKIVRKDGYPTNAIRMIDY